MADPTETAPKGATRPEPGTPPPEAPKTRPPKRRPAAKKATRSRAKSTNKGGRPPKWKPGKAVADFVTQAGGALAVVGAASERPAVAYDGEVLVHQAEAIGGSVQKLCDRNPKLGEAIEKLFKAGSMGVYLEAALVGASVAVPIMMAHGIIPADALGPFVGAVLPTDADGNPMMPPAPAPRPQPVETVAQHVDMSNDDIMAAADRGEALTGFVAPTEADDMNGGDLFAPPNNFDPRNQI